MFYNGTQSVLSSPQTYLLINDLSGNKVETGTSGVIVNTALSVNSTVTNITYPTSKTYLQLSNPLSTAGTFMDLNFKHGSGTLNTAIRSYLTSASATQLNFLTSSANTSYLTWIMNSTSNLSQLTASQSYFIISDSTLSNYITSSATGLALSSSVNLNIDLNGTPTNNIVLRVGGQTILSMGPNCFAPGYDCFRFNRPANNPIIYCSDNYIAPYSSAIDYWVPGTAVGDMVFRTKNKSIAFTVNDGLNSAMTVSSTNKVGITSTNPTALLQVNNIGAYRTNHLIISGQEFYASGFSGSGIALNIGVNRSGNKQLWIMDPDLAINGTNSCFRIGGTDIGAVSTDGLNVKDLSINGNLFISSSGNVGINNSNPSGKFQVSHGTNSNISVGAWNSTWSVFSNSTGPNTAGLGIGFDTAGTNSSVLYYNLAPGIAWLNVIFACNNYYFRSNGGGNVFNIAHLGTGTLYTNGGTLTNTNPSDATMKKDIHPMENSLSLITQLDPVSYHWIDTEKYGDKLYYGFLAQDIQEAIPGIVSEFKQPIKDAPQIQNPETGMMEDQQETKLGYDPVSLIPFLVGAIKEQQVQLSQLIKHMTELTHQVNSLTSKII
jgi:hypothetical protein